jgi:hypothetical protein
MGFNAQAPIGHYRRSVWVFTPIGYQGKPTVPAHFGSQPHATLPCAMGGVAEARMGYSGHLVK